MYRQQQGMTLIGWVITLAFGGLFLLGGLRLGPVYLEHMKVKSAMSKVASELGGKGAGVTEVSNALAKRYNVEGINHPDFKEIRIRKEGAGVRIVATHDHVVPYIGNVKFMVSFDDYVDVPR